MEIIAIILGIAGLIWGIILLRRGGLLAGCLAVMLAGACFSVEFFKVVLGPVPLTADRILLIVLVGQYLLWRRWGWADPKPLGKAEILLCLFTGMMVISTFSGDYTYLNYQPVSWLIIYYLMPFCMYWIVRQAEFNEKSMLAIFVCLTVFGGYLAVTSLAEYFQVWELVFPRYIADNASSATAEFVGRARGPFLNPISNGIALSICLGAALMIWPRLNRPGQLLMIPLYLLFFAAIYATMTRSVWLSGVLTLALVAGLAIPWNWRLPILGGGLLVGLADRRYAMGSADGLQARPGPRRRKNGRIGGTAARFGQDRLGHVSRSSDFRLRILAIQDRTSQLSFRPLHRTGSGKGPRLYSPQRRSFAFDRDGPARIGPVFGDCFSLGP